MRDQKLRILFSLILFLAYEQRDTNNNSPFKILFDK
jgi:hypothetical protein